MSMNSDVDTNINNYTREELLEILALNPKATPAIINSKITSLINKYTLVNNKKLVEFFQKVQIKLLKNNNNNKGNQNDVDQAEKWLKNQYLTQSNSNQTDKITQRENTVQLFNTGSNSVMNRERLGINNTIPVSVAQDSLNPTLRQTIKRNIIIDSKYRPNICPYSFDPNNPKGSDTNFTCTLTEQIKNVLSVELVSLHIPATWYTFDPYIGNTCFWIQYSDLSNTTFSKDDSCTCKICITAGNYATADDLINEINEDIVGCCPDLSGLRIYTPASNQQNPIIQMLNLTPYTIKVVFWPEPTNVTVCPGTGCGLLNAPPCTISTTYTQNLGYYLGYRILNSSSTSGSGGSGGSGEGEGCSALTVVLPRVQDITGNPYTTEINDFWTALNAGDINGATTIGIDLILSLQGYCPPPEYNCNWPNGYYKNTTAGSWFIGSAVTAIDLVGSQYILFILDDYNHNSANNGAIGISPPNTKLDLPEYVHALGMDSNTYVCDPSINVSEFVPSFPRKLTQAQLYSLNQIISNRLASNTDIQAPNNSNLLASIYNTPQDGGAIVYNNPTTNYKRTYFGPITLERLGIKLVDDKGNLVNLHGKSWSFTLAVEQLYQY
jgi:hypothetical protein